MLYGDKIWIAEGEDNPCYLLLNQANRHGVITGASGTGKTVTLKVLAESFSEAGVPVFLADVKGDVTGLAQPGDDTPKMAERIANFGISDWSYAGCPCRFWGMPGGSGIPVRVTVSDMGPTLLARLLGLSDVQTGVLNIVFRVADDEGKLLIDLKDLRAMLNYVAQNADEYAMEYGNIAQQSVASIVRSLIAIEDQGATEFFGEPALDLEDWFECAEDGRGYVNILDATKLVQMPKVYAMFLLWMLSVLFDQLPEVGDPDKPRFVFFFDEAHLLFDDMPSELEDKIIQVVKLIRSKGVGVYFISQSPSDIPNPVLAQLSNRIQHGLRAYTPAEQKAVKAAAASFRVNPNFDSEKAILELGTGEALVSCLDEKGRPCIVEKARILPPQCLMARASDEVIQGVLDAQCDLQQKYGVAIDRESAYELIKEKRAADAEAERLAAERAAFEAEKAAWEAQKAKEAAEAQKAADKESAAAAKEEARQAEIARREEERKALAEQRAAERQAAAEQRAAEKEADRAYKEAQREADRAYKEAQEEAKRAARAAEKEAEREQKAKEKAASQVSSVLLSIGREAGKSIVRNIFGSRSK